MPDVRLPGRAWSAILAAFAFSRAWSYVARPPAPDTGLQLIEEALPYWVWAVVVGCSACSITAGLLARGPRSTWALFAGHVGLLGCAAIFAASIAISALFLEQAWSGLGPLVVVCILHGERIISTGSTLGRR